MIKKNDPFYTFVVTRSNQNRIQIRRIEISKLWLQSVAGLALVSIGFISYSFYNLIRQTNESELAQHQQQLQLQTETERNKEQLVQLWQRIQSVEQTARKLAPPALASEKGEGGPEDAEIDTFNAPTSDVLYSKIRALEETLRDRASIPSIYPLVGKINNEFGWRSNPFGGGVEHHSGMDIDGNRGDLVIAPAEGVVVKTGWQGGYGNMIEISHGNNLTTRYGHLSQIGVEIGQVVNRGQEIGRVGSTGRSTGPHLHYEVRQDDQPIDPRGYLPPEPVIVNQ
ncbi:MAG: M23 family metallopeptidase [Acidobacteriota bacterium]|nr:M23 family metallopeptidase [Acidobacteriota bacterium]